MPIVKFLRWLVGATAYILTVLRPLITELSC